MKVTREVIYDLLPAYFAGEVSDDTRVLVEEYFASDPEFGRMAARFKTLVGERQRSGPMRAFYNPGVILGVVFGVTAVAIFVLSFRIKPNSWWRPLAGLDDAPLAASGLRRRNRRRQDA